jgi:undecaprenol kinase
MTGMGESILDLAGASVTAPSAGRQLTMTPNGATSCMIPGARRGRTLLRPDWRHMKNQSFLDRLGYAVAGLRHALRSERSLRLQVAALSAVVLVLAILRPGALWTALVLMASAAVIAAELFNTAIEALADRVQPEPDPAIRIVKDCAAAAVLVTSLAAVAVAIALAVHVMA